VVSSWLLRTKNRSAQNTRLRIQVERDAFARMTPYWQELGFPFQRLVPTLATSIGNSSDRPAALAELMGIIVNDGKRLPMLRLTQMHLGAGTPYETVMIAGRTEGDQVMKPEVARVLRTALAEVVDMGTARRVAGAFKLENGKRVVVGGKTGSGDNRFKTVNKYGGTTSSRAVNRTATFVFYIGDRYFGVMTSFVPGQESNRYSFTSALSVSVLRLLAPFINPRLDEPPATLETELRWAAPAATVPSVASGKTTTTLPSQVTTLPAAAVTGG
jgi:membrane peptidoglycan carboxypeptidase